VETCRTTENFPICPIFPPRPAHLSLSPPPTASPSSASTTDSAPILPYSGRSHAASISRVQAVDHWRPTSTAQWFLRRRTWSEGVGWRRRPLHGGWTASGDRQRRRRRVSGAHHLWASVRSTSPGLCLLYLPSLSPVSPPLSLSDERSCGGPEGPVFVGSTGGWVRQAEIRPMATRTRDGRRLEDPPAASRVDDRHDFDG
jgi:hypothetical protein